MAVPALAPFLLAIAGHIVGRVLVSLGMSVVTIKGVDVVFGALKSQIVMHINQLPSAVYSLMMIAGFGVALNMFFAAVTFRLTYWALTKMTGFYLQSS